MGALRNYTCKQCGEEVVGRSDLIAHYKANHGGIKPHGYNKKKDDALRDDDSSYAVIRKAEEQIKQAIKGLEEERDFHQRKLLELDGLISKYNGNRITVH